MSKLYKICLVSDFFYPNVGGVEEHIFNLAQCLLAIGHKVIVMTHSYGDRVGIRYMTNGLKVYYIPIKVFYNQAVFPSIVCNIPIIRNIYIREQIEIVHGHSAFSSLAHESMLIGKLMNLKTVFTDHSLFGFADTSAIIINKLAEIFLFICNHCICVSHISKENTVLRAKVAFDSVSVIPNAVDTYRFIPQVKLRSNNTVNVVIVSRLVYRKGIDLMAQVMVETCLKYPEVNFIVGGDGPKRKLLEEIRKKNNLQNRITLLGNLKHSEVCNVLNQGHILLNTSLTEAFCMVVVEAASCGLQVVSTMVGGIPEVLPESFIHLAEPLVPDLMKAIDKAITSVKLDSAECPYKCNNEIRKYYNWKDVAARNSLIYDKVFAERNSKVGSILASYMVQSFWPYTLFVTFCYFVLRLLDILYPKRLIDLAVDYNHDMRSKNK